MNTIISTLLFILAGLFFAYGILTLVKSRLAIGEAYDQARIDLEQVRQTMKKQGTKVAEIEIEKFNKLAKRLRVSEYK